MKTKVLGLALAALCVITFGCKKTGDNTTNTGPVTPIVLQGSSTSVDLSAVQQTVEGFGGASILQYIPDLTSAQRTTAFSPTSGIGMSILRVMVPPVSSSFAAEKPTIDAAKGFGATVVATAWNAPANMMTGNHLNTADYAAYASYLSSYNSAVGGVHAISPFNEPNYTGATWMQASVTEVSDFVAAQGSNWRAPIMGPEPFNMDQNFISTYLSNTTAASKTSFVSGHIYGKTPWL
jgi:glucuronoarabinoxylan endo-1,4-beta-xylanase